MLERFKNKAVYLKVVVSLALFCYLVLRLNYHALWETLAGIKIGWFIVAVTISFVANLLACWRWYYLMLMNDTYHSPSYLETLKIFFISIFYNNFLPSSVGGDVVKAARLGTLSKNSESSVSAVLVDRLVGLFAAVILGILAGLIDYQNQRGLIIEMIIILSLFVLLIGLFIEGNKIVKLSRPLCRLFGREDFASKLMASFRTYFKDPKVIIYSFASALLFQAMCNLIIYSLALSLNLSIAIAPFFVIMPIVTVITLIPISINGLGVQDAAMVSLFSPLGIAGAAILSLSLLNHFQRFIFSLLGGAIILWENVQHLSRQARENKYEKI